MYEILFKFCRKSMDILDRWALNFCVVLLVMTVSLNAIEIFTRYFLDYSSSYSMELAVTLSSATYFICYAVLMIKDEDVAMSFFYNKFKVKTQKIIDTAINLLVMMFMAVLLVNTINLFIMTSEVMHSVFPIKQSYTVVPLLVGSGICLWVSLFRLWNSLDDLLRRNYLKIIKHN